MPAVAKVPTPSFEQRDAARRANIRAQWGGKGLAKTPLNSMNTFEQQDIERRANIRARFGGQAYVRSTPFSIVPQEQARLTEVRRLTAQAIAAGQMPNKISTALAEFSGYTDPDLLSAGYLLDSETGWWYLPEESTQSPTVTGDGGAGGEIDYGGGGGGGGGGGYGPFGRAAPELSITNWRIGL